MQQTRELSEREASMCNRKDVVNLVIPARLNTKVFLDTTCLDQAVYKFIKSQPNLSAVLRKDGERLFFSPLEEIKNYFEVLSKDNDWQNICIEYSNKHLRDDFETFPPYKVLFLQPSVDVAYLIVASNHYAMDGTNGISSISDILEIYSKLRENPNYEPKAHNPAPSVDEMTNSILRPSELVNKKQDFKDYTLKILNSINCTVPIENESTAKVLFITYTSSESTYQQLRDICHERGCTLGVVLCAVKYFAFAAAMFSRQKNLPEELSLAGAIPINMRGRLLSMDALPWRNCNFSVADPLIGVRLSKSMLFWDLVKSIKKEFTCLLDEKNKFYMFDLTRFDRLLTEEEKDIVAKAGEILGGLKRHFCFSNMKW